MPSVVVHDRLRLAAGEQRRTVSARKEADDGFDRAHGLGVAAVDAAAFLEDRAADDVGLEALDRLRCAPSALAARLGEGFLGLLADFVELSRTLGLVGQLVGRLDILADEGLELGLGRGLGVAGGELPRLLGGLFGEVDDRFADLLRRRWANMTAPSMSSSDSSLASDSTIITASRRAGDDEVEIAFGDLLLGRVEDVLAILVSRRGRRRSGP